MGCLRLDILEKENTGLKVVYRKSSSSKNIVQRFLSVDPLASQFGGWNPFNFTYNNPIRFLDTDGMAAEDWVRTSSGAIINDAKVIDKASAQERYGADAQYIGKSATFVDGSGSQVSLNENGSITKAAFLPTALVEGSSEIDKADQATQIATTVGVGGDVTASMFGIGAYFAGSIGKDKAIQGVSKVVGKIGTATNGIGLVNDLRGIYKDNKYGKAQFGQFMDGVVNTTMAAFVDVGSTVIFPLINQTGVFIEEGAHEGRAYNDENNILPNTYTLDKDWNLVLQESMDAMNSTESEKRGKEIMKNTIKVLTTVVGGPKETLVEKGATIVTKSVINKAAEKLLEVEQP